MLQLHCICSSLHICRPSIGLSTSWNRVPELYFSSRERQMVWLPAASGLYLDPAPCFAPTPVAKTSWQKSKKFKMWMRLVLGYNCCWGFFVWPSESRPVNLPRPWCLHACLHTYMYTPWYSPFHVPAEKTRKMKGLLPIHPNKHANLLETK